MKPTRTRLSDRRPTETIDVRHNGQRYHVSVGRFPDGSVSEIFITGPKSGSDLAAVIHDTAVALSIAAQYGVPLEEIRRASMRNADGSPGSPIGAVLEKLMESRDQKGSVR